METLPTISERIRHDAVFIFPYSLIGALFVCNVISIPLPLLHNVEIPFVLMAIYYWAMYRPTLVPAWLLFVIGMLMDVLSGLPLGLNTIIFIAIGWGVSRKRRFLMSQPFFVIWCMFVAVCLLAFSLRWGLFSLLHADIVDYTPVLYGTLIGGLSFPLISVMLRLTHKILPVGPRSKKL